MKIASAQVFPIRLPLKVPLVTSMGILRRRNGALLRLETQSGWVGWGEASPYPGFGLEAPADARAAMTKASAEMVGVEVESLEDWISFVGGWIRKFPTAMAGIETALLDLVSRSKGLPLRDLLSVPGEPSTSRAAIVCNALVTGDSVETVSASAQVAMSRGYRTFKLKVGAVDLAADIARIACLREIVGAESSIRLDANRAYQPEDAIEAIESFARYEIEYLEEPLAVSALDQMLELRERAVIPLAADESATTEVAAARVIEAGAADVIVIKPSAAGGPFAGLRVARAARRAGLRVVVTSLIDSAVGVSAARETAAAIAGEGELLACGLATGDLFERDVAALERSTDGNLMLSKEPGLGIELCESVVRGLSSSLVENRSE